MIRINGYRVGVDWNNLGEVAGVMVGMALSIAGPVAIGAAFFYLTEGTVILLAMTETTGPPRGIVEAWLMGIALLIMAVMIGALVFLLGQYILVIERSDTEEPEVAD